MIHFKNNKIITGNRKGNVDKCPVCDNRIGFAFGTCVDCGFNYLDGTFRFIKVDIDYLPMELREALVREHADMYDVKTYSKSRRNLFDYDYK